jgi:tetratricopeptide (TPR) repeat protein
MGHATAALLITKAKVTVYIGSYGDPAQSSCYKLGRFTLWFKYNPFTWKAGLCQIETQISMQKRLIYTLCGPIASVTLACILVYLGYRLNASDTWSFVILIFLISALLDLYSNLRPKARAITLYGGKIIHNDGYMIALDIQNLRNLQKYKKLYTHFEKKEFDSLITQGQKILGSNESPNMVNVYRLLMSASMQLKDYDLANTFYERYHKRFIPSSHDFSILGLMKSNMGKTNESLHFYNLALEKDGSNTIALNNKGYVLIKMEKFEEAIPSFLKAISIDQTFAFAYNNLGHCYIKTGRKEDGLRNILKSFELDQKNPYVYRNLGIYYLEVKDYPKALEQFNKSKQMDEEVDDIDDLITFAKNYL